MSSFSIPLGQINLETLYNTIKLTQLQKVDWKKLIITHKEMVYYITHYDKEILLKGNKAKDHDAYRMLLRRSKIS
ncbi:MAG: hypothetical protein ACI86H_002411 [bacterium]|jgi:hypothetical protein